MPGIVHAPVLAASAALLAGLTCGGHGAAAAACQFGSGSRTFHRIMYFQFDNVHFRRDNPNVPSDLEQMPHLLNFLVRTACSTPITTRP